MSYPSISRSVWATLKGVEISLKKLEAKRMRCYMKDCTRNNTYSFYDFWVYFLYFLAWRHHARPYHFSVKWCCRLSRRRGIELDSKNVSLCWTRRLLWTLNFRQSLFAEMSTPYLCLVFQKDCGWRRLLNILNKN